MSLGTNLRAMMRGRCEIDQQGRVKRQLFKLHRVCSVHMLMGGSAVPKRGVVIHERRFAGPSRRQACILSREFFLFLALAAFGACQCIWIDFSKFVTQACKYLSV